MKFLFIFISLFVSTLLYSQAPEGINYQAVMRNSNGNLVTSTTVAIRVQIRQGSATGTTVYQERQSIASSNQGLINMVIGAGTPQVGTFNNINWAVGPFFVNLSVDFSNGVNYQDFGTQQLMSVPYALYAKTSGAQLNQWRYGNTIPANSFGVLGDFYLDVVTGNVYYKNSTTTWVLTGNIRGPVGPSGAIGATGPQGAQGAQGIQGAPGAQGTQGVAGANGNNGQNTLVKTTNEAVGTNCTTGGIKIEYGLDANSNGTLDVSEINASLTKYVCNGAVGATGSTGPAGAQGTQGIQGVAGTNGSDGKNTLAKTTTEAAGANCTTGGVKIEYGLDANSNGTLDVSEINAALTRYVCNGATGAQGIQGLTGAQGIQGAAGAAGTNGAQGIQGVAGTNGTDGKNTLAKTTTETAGANCTTGGVKIEYGLDANSNGNLDVSEVNATLTRYVCNGATGAQGIQGLTGAQGIQGVAGTNGADGKNTLAKTTTEAAGANCTTGGVKIEYGLDANSNGTLDVSEINATLTRYVCNGATGAQGIQGLTGVTGSNGTNGLNALIKTTSEPSGTNCTNGGTKIETGLDTNGNGVLDASEVNASQTQFVCNGTSATASSNQGVRIGFSSSTTWTCPAGVTQITIELWGGGGGGGGGSFATTATGATNGCLVGCNYIGGKGGNGGLGGYNKSLITVVSGQTYIITVGLGGSKGLGQTNNSGFPGPSATNGGNGGNTSFGSFLTASGGIGGGSGISSSSSCVNGANGSNGSVNNFQNNSYPIQSNTSARNYIPVGYVTSFVSTTCCSASGSGGSGGNSSALNGNCMYGYQNGFDGTAGENGYCVISY